MIPPWAYPLVEPPPLHPNATPSERLEYQRQMEAHRRAVRERDNMMGWDMAVHIVAAGVLILTAFGGFLAVIYSSFGARGLSLAFGIAMVLILAVVEVKRRL